jgi:hypothetical protein
MSLSLALGGRLIDRAEHRRVSSSCSSSLSLSLSLFWYSLTSRSVRLIINQMIDGTYGASKEHLRGTIHSFLLFPRTLRDSLESAFVTGNHFGAPVWFESQLQRNERRQLSVNTRRDFLRGWSWSYSTNQVVLDSEIVSRLIETSRVSLGSDIEIGK